MPFNLLLIPLMGGYIFVRFWHYSKISILRADKDRLLIRASIAGFFSLGLAFALSILSKLFGPARRKAIVCTLGGRIMFHSSTWASRFFPF
jgi:hypothetical protein